MLPMDFAGFRVVAAETFADTAYVMIQAKGETCRCPSCGCESRSVHSTYIRQLRDLPNLGRPVRVRALIRRFRCRNRGCPRQTFSEPLSGLAEARAQRTQRLTSVLQTLILDTSSITGARLAMQMGIQTSPRTLLRAAGCAERPIAVPPVLGVDDFALRRGRTYGTILCDLETGRPIDVLLGRAAEPLINWLKQRPGVKVFVRDRASAYADAARAGAPDAVQVADRFHLVRNVCDALQEVVDRQSWTLPEAPVPVASVAEQPLPEARRPSQAARRREAAAVHLQRRILQPIPICP